MEGSVVPTYPSIHQTAPCCFWSSGYCRRATCSAVRDKLILHPEQCHKRKSIYEGSPWRVRGRCKICQKKKKKLVVSVQQFFIHKGCNGVITQMVCAERDISSQIPSKKLESARTNVFSHLCGFILSDAGWSTAMDHSFINCNKTWRGLAGICAFLMVSNSIWYGEPSKMNRKCV